MPCYRVVVLLDGHHFAPIIEADDATLAGWRALRLAEAVHPESTFRVRLPARLLHTKRWHFKGSPRPDQQEPLRP